MTFEDMWRSLLPIGLPNDSEPGYRRFSWTRADRECREWFSGEAGRRGMPASPDRNGNLWAWWGDPPLISSLPNGTDRTSSGGVVTGSHLDSVPGGGAFDGPLGVVSGFAAIDLLRERGFRPARPIAVAAFTEEEGARFGVACLGSRLLTGAIDPDRARELRDGDGVTLAAAMDAAGHDPAAIGPDPETLGRIGCFVELHIEQGRAMDGPVGVADSIWPHGRWRFDFSGEGNHAGTTRLADRRDPMLPFARTVLAAREAAARHDAVATIGKVQVAPNGVNAIPSSVAAWLDARGPAGAVDDVVADVEAAARRHAAEHGVGVAVSRESFTTEVSFDDGLAARLAAAITADSGVKPPVLPTGAGHDAGILSARVPAAMLFVRNPTGVSHAPSEHAELADCLAGVSALAAVLADLAS